MLEPPFTLCWFPALSQSTVRRQGGDTGHERGAEPPLWLWLDTGLQQERLEGGTDTARSYFPPPAEKFSQRLGRP